MKRVLTVLCVLFAFSFAAAAQTYVVTNDDTFFVDNTVSVFSLDSTGGLHALAGSPFLTGGMGAGGGSGALGASKRIAVSPDGKRIFAANGGTGDVSVFSIAEGGALTLVPGSPFVLIGGASSGISLAVSPDGHFLYAANATASNISAFSIASDGVLQPVAGSPFSAGGVPIDISLTADSKFLAASLFDLSGGLIAMFNVGADGSLVAVPGSPFPDGSPAGAVTASVALSSTGKLFVANDAFGLPKVDVFNIAADGNIAHITGSPFTAPGNGIGGITLSSNQQRLFAGGSPNSVSVFDVGPDGGLALVSGAPFPAPTGISVAQVALDPTGQFLFATMIDRINIFSVVASGSLAFVSDFLTGADGGLTSLVAFSVQQPPPPPENTPFQEFHIESLAISQAPAGSASYELRADFVLGEKSNGIDAEKEAVEIHVGPSNLVIPAGSFSHLPNDRLVLQTTIGDSRINAFLVQTGTSSYTLHMVAHSLDLTGVQSPVTVQLKIGDDEGTSTE